MHPRNQDHLIPEPYRLLRVASAFFPSLASFFLLQLEEKLKAKLIVIASSLHLIASFFEHTPEVFLSEFMAFKVETIILTLLLLFIVLPLLFNHFIEVMISVSQLDASV